MVGTVEGKRVVLGNASLLAAEGVNPEALAARRKKPGRGPDRDPGRDRWKGGRGIGGC